MNDLKRILSEVYGAGTGVFDSTPVLWAADRLADEKGVDTAKAQLKSLNRLREKLMLPVAVPAFGHRLF